MTIQFISQTFAAQVVTLVLLLISAGGPVAGQAQTRLQKADRTVIDQFIVQQQSEEAGFEDEGNERTIMAGDLNRDGLPDVIVLYMLEGQNSTNNYVQHLAVFVRRNGRLEPATDAVVGGKYYRAAELKAIKNNQILFETEVKLTVPLEPIDRCCGTASSKLSNRLGTKKKGPRKNREPCSDSDCRKRQ